MPNLALSWQQAGVLATVLFAAALALSQAGGVRSRRSRPVLLEIGVIAALYSLWQLAGTLSVLGTDGALTRARWIVRCEHDLHLPAETSVQRLILPHPLLVEVSNVYYATLHFTALFVLLGWLFFWHRDRYAEVRTTVVLLTVACLLIQFIPVAPPRLLPGLGFVDTARLYGQSVYGSIGGLAADQLSAMPSVHVGWAALVGLTVVRVGRHRLRWLALLYPALTVFVVVATGNHFWLDGIVAIVLLALALGVQLISRGLWRRLARLRGAAPAEGEYHPSMQPTVPAPR